MIMWLQQIILNSSNNSSNQCRIKRNNLMINKIIKIYNKNIILLNKSINYNMKFLKHILIIKMTLGYKSRQKLDHKDKKEILILKTNKLTSLKNFEHFMHLN